MSTDKIAQSAVVARSAVITRQLAEKTASLMTENEQLRTKVASYERADRVRALAAQMEERGLSPELTFDEKIASVASCTNLDHVEHAIKLAGGGKLDLPRVSDVVGSGTTDVGTSSFLNYCVTGQGN